MKNNILILILRNKQYYRVATLLQWRTQKTFMGGFVQGHMVVICIWCAPFVTSQFDVIFIFPNQRFGEVC